MYLRDDQRGALRAIRSFLLCLWLYTERSTSAFWGELLLFLVWVLVVPKDPHESHGGDGEHTEYGGGGNGERPEYDQRTQVRVAEGLFEFV